MTDPLANMVGIGDAEFDREHAARIQRLERDAYHDQGIVVVRLKTETNPILRRLAADRGFTRFGPINGRASK